MLMRLFIIIAAALAGGGALMALAQPAAELSVPDAAAEDRAALARAKAQAAEAETKSAALAREADTIADAAQRASQQAAAMAISIQASEAAIEAARVRLAMVQRRLAEQRALLAERQAPMLRLTGALQSLSRRPPITVLASPGSIEEMVHVRIVLDQIMPEIERRTAGLQQELARTRAIREEAQLAARALQGERDRLGERRRALVRLEGERRARSRQLAASAAIEGDRAIAMAEEARDLTGLLDELAGNADVRDRLAQLPGPAMRPAAPGRAAASVDSAAAAPGGPPAYRLPVLGRLVAGFGEMTDGGARMDGISIRTQAGAQVVAPANGRIAFAGPYRGYGTIIIIDHGSGWSSLVTNLIARSVNVGDSVSQGSPIGRAGPDRPIITVELRRQGRPIDIATLL